MQNNSQKRGLALGAVFALVASLFVGVTPAVASTPTPGANIALTPLRGPVDNFNGTILESFPLSAYLLPGQTNPSWSANAIRYEITKVSGNVDILFSASPSVSGVIPDGVTSASSSVGVIPANQSTASVTASGALVNSGTTARLTIRAFTNSPAASLSAVTAVVSVKIWLENAATQNNEHDELEWSTVKTITLHAVTAVPITGASIADMTAPLDTAVTASATVGALNFRNLGGRFYLQLVSAKLSGPTSTSFVSANEMVSRSGVVSGSLVATPVNPGDSFSGRVMYSPTGSGSVAFAMGTTFSMVVANPGVTALSISPVLSDDLDGGASSFLIRQNQAYTVQIVAQSGSASVSKAVTVRLTGTALVTSSRMISINGAAFTATYPAAGFTVTTGTNGVGSFTLATTGFVPGNSLTITANVLGITATPVLLTVATVSYRVESDNGSLVATAPGTTVNIPFTVTDQWGVLSSRTDQFLEVDRSSKAGSSFNFATTRSYHAVTAGVATVAFTPEPATKTGSAIVTVRVVRLENGAYIDASDTDEAVEVTVTGNANAFTTGLASSYAASVSYFPNTVSNDWVTVTGKVAVTGSAVTITGDSSLVFRKGAGSATSSTLTVFTNASAEYSFQVAGRMVGSKVFTLTNGSATTTSLLVVSSAAHDSGRSITWDTSTIESGRTKVVTGTLTDANGNPVDTTGGAATILVTWAGSGGIVVGTLPTETDVDGKFRLSVLTSATDAGSLTITAVYMPQGPSTVAANKVTSIQSINVAPLPAPEVNAVIGSFQGRWAVRIENAKGAVVSVKVGGNWFKFTSLNDNYLFSRKSRKGATLAVSVWVNGELQNSQTITVR